MKTLSKKLLTMLLAVVMLVSVVPFQAMAADYQNVIHFVDANGAVMAKSYGEYEWQSETTPLGRADAEKRLAETDLSGYKLTDEFTEMTPTRQDENGLWVYEVTLVKAEDEGNGDTPVDPTVDETDKYTLTVEVRVGPKGNDETYTKTYEYEENTEVTLTDDMIKAAFDGYSAEKYTKSDWYPGSKVTMTEDKSVAIRLTEKEEPTEPTEKPTEPTEKPEEDKSVIKLMVDGELYATATISDGKVGVLPTEPLKNGKQFTAWYENENGTGDKLYKGMPADEVDDDRTYHAAFKTSDDDGLGNLTVYAKFYVGGKLKDTVKLYTERDLENGTNAFDWLTANKDRTYNAIFDRVDAEDYEWEDRYYYDYEGKEPLSKQDLVMDGDRSVVVKVYSKHESNVLLYVHRKVSSAAENIYEMGGYVKGDVVSREAVESVVKKHYSGKRTIKGLYSDEAWSQLKNGEDPTQANGITVDSNGTVKIHILLSNATSNGNADSSNPKTGDTIFMTITVMAVSAMGLACAYIFTKKRMVK